MQLEGKRSFLSSQPLVAKILKWLVIVIVLLIALRISASVWPVAVIIFAGAGLLLLTDFKNSRQRFLQTGVWHRLAAIGWVTPTKFGYGLIAWAVLSATFGIGSSLGGSSGFLDISGTGTYKSDSFSAPANGWKINYSYNCHWSGGGLPKEFAVEVGDPSNPGVQPDVVVLEDSAEQKSSTSDSLNGGTYFIQIETLTNDCSWHVTAVPA